MSVQQEEEGEIGDEGEIEGDCESEGETGEIPVPPPVIMMQVYGDQIVSDNVS